MRPSYGDDPVHGRGRPTLQGALRRRRRRLHRLQRHRRQRGGPPIAPAPVRSGDLRGERPHQRRRVRRPGAVPGQQAHRRWPRRTGSSPPIWSKAQPAASGTSTTSSPGSCRSPSPPRSGPATGSRRSRRSGRVGPPPRHVAPPGRRPAVQCRRLPRCRPRGVRVGCRRRCPLIRGHQERRHGCGGGRLVPTGGPVRAALHPQAVDAAGLEDAIHLGPVHRPALR